MAIYAVGDVHGYLQPLLYLLKIINFNTATDQLWLTGDMVNRGPDSLEVLRLVRDLGAAAKPVLGNHDLHLLFVAYGVRQEKKGDTLKQILTAPDRDELITWLRYLPFVHTDESIKTLIVHAGVFIKWNKNILISYCNELESLLQGEHYLDFLEEINYKKTKKWNNKFNGWPRHQFIANTLTHMRFCTYNDNLDFRHKGKPGSQPDTLTPWFRHPRRHCTKWRIVFGHWSTLGYLKESNLISLNSGCLWGKKLTLVQLDSEEERMWQAECS